MNPKRALIVFGLFVAALFAASAIDASRLKVVPYSEFKAAVKNDTFSEVLVGQEQVEGTLKNGTKDLRGWTALKVEDKDLVPLLEQKGIKYEARSESNWFRDSVLGWVIPFVVMVFIWQFVLGRMGGGKGGPAGVLSFGKSRAKLVADTDLKTRFKDVAGCDEAKEELQEIIEFLKSPGKFRDIGGRIPKGVLLVGPPGTGKTLLARAVAGEAGVAFFHISGSDFVEMFVGVGAARVRDLFAQAKKAAPCIVFIDELDAIAKSRGGGFYQGNDEREQTLNAILVEMDGFNNNSGVILMAATNRPEVLDPAILRPGRFDRQVVVDRPDLKGREEILRVHVRDVKVDPSVNLHSIASRTPGFSGADLANVVNEAALLAVRRGLLVVDREAFEEAIDRVMAGLARKSRVISPDVKKTIAVHEIGHAVVARFTPGADRVHRISIVPRSSGALGFTLQIPEEDRHLMSRTQLLGMIRVLLGGRAAEQVIFGEVTSGASDDLKRASGIIRRMITEFGMGQSLGLVSLGGRAPGYLDNPFIGNDGAEVSNQTQQAIDAEVRKILSDEFENACHILRSKRDIVDELTAKLLEVETLEGDGFEAIVGRV